MCASHPRKAGEYLLEYPGVELCRPGRMPTRIALAPEGDGNHETLEENRDWRGRGGGFGRRRRRHGSPKWQERGHSADRESAARGFVVPGERLGRDQAQDVRQHRRERLWKDHPPVCEGGGSRKEGSIAGATGKRAV